MRECNSVWAVHVEGLRFGTRAGASSGISQVSETHETWEVLHSGSIMEDLGSHSIAFALIYSSTGGTSSYATSILSSVLEIVQRIVEVGSGSCGRRITDVAKDESEDSAHPDRFRTLLKCVCCRIVSPDTKTRFQQSAKNCLFSLNIFSALFSPKSNILKYFIHHNSRGIEGLAKASAIGKEGHTYFEVWRRALWMRRDAARGGAG